MCGKWEWRGVQEKMIKTLKIIVLIGTVIVTANVVNIYPDITPTAATNFAVGWLSVWVFEMLA